MDKYTEEATVEITLDEYNKLTGLRTKMEFSLIEMQTLTNIHQARINKIIDEMNELVRGLGYECD